MNITLREFKDSDYDYNLLYKWCQNIHVYEWFEQRKLTFDEIKNKYSNKLYNKKQKLFIIKYNDLDIGYTQIYKYENDANIKNIDKFKNLYEFDLFIGEKDYLNKGIGSIIINEISNYIYSNYEADAIMLRSFKRNIRAIKCYIKSGYQIIDEYNGIDSLNNEEIITVLINKKH